jgi:hypothetical protein
MDRAAVRQAQGAVAQAREKKDWPALVAASLRLTAVAPKSMGALATLAGALSLNGEKAEALAALNRLADAGWTAERVRLHRRTEAR